MKRFHHLVAPALLLALGTTLAGCDLLNAFKLPMDSASDPAATNATDPAATGQAPVAAPAKENFACRTPNYVATVTWQGEQAVMGFGRSNEAPTVQNVSAAVKANADGSFTYEFNQNALFYTRVYPDRTCLIQVINPTNNTVAVEESGALG
ncbi:MAG: hypothetical protein MUF72_16830 [Elainella sp. Prado103]|jgi:hypothetical protein|nr:hypothetical protein [Elainella sp. Prado103]